MATGKRYFWIKLRESFMTSDTVDFLMSQKDGANYVVLYQMLCLKTINTGGRLSRTIGEIVIPYDVEKIQRDCKWFSADTVRVALDLYKRLGLIYEDETLYQATLTIDNISYADIMQGWYYAAAEQQGLKAPDESLTDFCGSWSEKVAHRGIVTISKSLAPGKVTIEASWPESAAVQDTWVMTASLSKAGTLIYSDGIWISTEYGVGGEGWIIGSDENVNGEFSLNEKGELVWVDSKLDSSIVNEFVKD